MVQIFILIILSFYFIGCATISKEDCQSEKWQELGQRDGVQGNTKDYFFLYQKSCEAAKQTSAKDLYFQGWNDGHIKYCTAQNGYVAGLNSIHSAHYCEPDKFPEYGENYKLGYKVASLQNDKSEIDKELTARHEDRSVVADVGRALSSLGVIPSPNEKLIDRKVQINEKIRAIDSNAPGGPQVRFGGNAAATEALRSALMAIDPESFQNKTGATLGTIVGFGLGHAIQGRYMDSGWKWTLGEIGTLTLANVTSSSDCSDGPLDPVSGIAKRTCVNNGKDPQVAVGTILLWLGFRVWQSYDLWNYPPTSDSSQSAFFLTPNGVAWAGKF